MAENITKRRQLEEEIRKKCAYCKLLGTAAISANEAVEIKDAFYPVLDEICTYTSWEIGHSYVISKDDPDLLEPISVCWHKDHKRFKEFCDVSKKIKYARGIGLPGRVLASGRPLWIEDVTKDKNFLRTKAAKAVNIKSGIAFPVMVGSKVVAVLTFFTTEATKPDQQFLDIMVDVGTQLGRVVERKEAESALKKSEEKYHKLIDTANDAIFIADVETGIILDVNKRAEELMKMPAGKIVGMHQSQLHPQEEAETYKKIFNNHVLQRRGVSEDIFITRADGRKVPVEISASVIEWDDKKVIQGIFRDITERKQMEEALLQSEKMKALGIMTAGVAHEFNNVLAIISANAQYLEENYRDDKALTKVLRTICRVSDDGADIVERMYEFISARKVKSGFIRVDIKGLIKQAIDFTMPRWKGIAQGGGIDYHINLKDIKALPSVSGSPSELREVFVNIINNALDAMPDGGRLSFSTRREDSSVFISISDTGTGMPEKVKNRIFDPFFTTRSPEGTGLGMSTTYGIITRHGGNIDVESEEGKGSTITVSLPIPVTAASQAVTPESVKKINIKNLNVLLVDDEQDICESLSDIFAVEGHKVKSVHSGKEAMELLRNNTFDLLICDLVMPGVTGRDVIKALETRDKRPKIGIMTGWKYNIRDAEDEGLKVDFVVRKPFKISELRKDINKAFNS